MKSSLLIKGTLWYITFGVNPPNESLQHWNNMLPNEEFTEPLFE